MKIIEISEMPVFRFAHTFEADSYEKSMPPRTDGIEISYITQGVLHVTKGRERYDAEKGDILCGIRDVATSVRAEGFHRHHTVFVGTRWRESESRSYGLHIPYILKYCRESEEIFKLIDEFIYASHVYQNSPSRTAQLFLKILCKIDRAYLKNFEKKMPEQSILAEKAKNYIQQNINIPITQKEIAEHLGVSPGHLCRVFKQAEGQTLIKYVNTAKLRGIRNLITKENVKLYKAAELYGYSDSNYVSSLYKKMFGHNITDAVKTKDAKI